MSRKAAFVQVAMIHSVLDYDKSVNEILKDTFQLVKDGIYPLENESDFIPYKVMIYDVISGSCEASVPKTIVFDMISETLDFQRRHKEYNFFPSEIFFYED